MDILFEAGFLGTRAPLFMDIVSVIVSCLPFMVYGAILLAKREAYHLHQVLQMLLFTVTLIVVLFFEYGVRKEGGYQHLMKGSLVSHDYLFYVLLVHIAIATVTLLAWLYTLYSARRYAQQHTLPGLYSPMHKKDGIRTFVGIILTALTGLWVYALLFIF